MTAQSILFVEMRLASPGSITHAHNTRKRKLKWRSHILIPGLDFWCSQLLLKHKTCVEWELAPRSFGTSHFCCEQTFWGISERLVAPNSFRRFLWQILQVWKKNHLPMLLRDLPNILQSLSCFGHFCSKKRSGSEHESFCRVWECQFLVGSVRVTSGETAFFSQILEFCAQFQVEFGLYLEITVGRRKFAFCTALCCCLVAENSEVSLFPHTNHLHPKKTSQTENLTFFRAVSFRIPAIWAWRSMGSDVRVQEFSRCT